MKKFCFHFLLTALLATVAAGAAAVRLAGYGTTGAALTYGSGWAGGSVYLKPAVSDHPRVAFIAPDPAYATSILSEYRASYLIAPLSANPAATLLFAGQESFLGTSYVMPNWQIAGTPDLATCFAIRQGSIGMGERYVQFLGPLNGQAVEGLPAFVTDASRLTISADGATAAIGGQTGMLLVDITANSFTPINLAGTPLASNTGNSVGLSADGDIVLFASDTMVADGLTRIYRYKRGSGALENVAVAEAADLALADAQVVATPDGNTAVFVATNYELWSGSANDGRNTQIIAATRLTNGNWTTSPCSIGPHIEASEPSASADGRFVAFRATNTITGATNQVFRYDRLTQTTVLASTAASGQPADAPCEVPSISPNGRYLAFVSRAANLGDAPADLHHVWLSDLGPTLTGGTLALPTNSSSRLPIHLINANAGDTLQWSAAETLPGAITWLDQGTARPVTASTPYPVATLPWTFTAGSTPGAATIALTLHPADGAPNREAFIDLQVFAVDIPRQLPVSIRKDGAFAPLGGLPPPYVPVGCSLSEDGVLAAFATNISLDPDQDWGSNDFDIYLRQLNGTVGELKLLTGELAPSANFPMLSGNGATVFFIAGNNLYTVPTTSGAPELLPDTDGVSAVAASHDGTVLALVRNGEAWRRRHGQTTRLGDQAGFSTPLLSRDGQTAAFLDGDGRLFVWTAADNSWRHLASDVRQVSMTLDGATLYCQADSDGSLSVIATGSGSTGALSLPGLPAGVTANDLSQPTISPNRRFLVYFRAAEGVYQLFRYDLAANTETMVSASTEGLPGNDDSGLPLAISGAGDRILYATTAANLLPGKTGSGRELALAVFSDQPGAAPILATTTATAPEAASITVPLDCHSSFGAAAPVLLSQPQHGQAELLGPAAGRDGHALRLIPNNPDFCGQDSAVIKLFDGSLWSADTTVTLTVENINDAPTWQTGIPAEATTHILNEGQVLAGAPALGPYASDPDQTYAAITGETLSFSLVGAPAWLALDQDGRLATTAPPSYDIASRDVDGGQTVFDFSVRVTDRAGAFADLPLCVTVVNVNRPPLLLASPARITEGVPLAWSDFTLSDPDPEDQNKLRLVFTTPAKGLLVRQDELRDGAAVTQFGPTDFPIVYQAQPREANTDTAQISVVDGGGASSEPVAVAIRLRKVDMKMSDLWSAAGPGALLPAQLPGWALLSVPVEMPADALRQAFGSALWAWDATSGVYFQLVDEVQAGQGFWVLIAETPVLDNAFIQGARPVDATLPTASGWHLVGPPTADHLPAADRLFGGPSSQSYQRGTGGQTREGAGYWYFRP